MKDSCFKDALNRENTLDRVQKYCTKRKSQARTVM